MELSPKEKEKMNTLMIEMNEKMREKIEELMAEFFRMDFKRIEKLSKEFDDEFYWASFKALVDKQILFYRITKNYHPELSENEILTFLILSRMESGVITGIDSKDTIKKAEDYYTPLVNNPNKTLEDIIYTMVNFEYIIDRPSEMPPIPTEVLEGCREEVRQYIKESILKKDDEIFQQCIKAEITTLAVMERFKLQGAKKTKTEDEEEEFKKRVEKRNKISRNNPEPLIQWLIDSEQISEDEEENLVNLIKARKQEIFNKLSKNKESLNDYEFIIKKFKTGDISNDDEFKKVYRRFYVLNGAGLTDKFMKRYFELLSRKEADLKNLLWELSKIPRRKGDYSIQLSFASKLIHTIDNNQPIYDSRVAELLDIKLDYNIKDMSKRINDRIEKYNLLKKKFNKILSKKDIKEIIKDFKIKLKTNIGDVKMLDFMLWKLGDMVIKKRKVKK